MKLTGEPTGMPPGVLARSTWHNQILQATADVHDDGKISVEVDQWGQPLPNVPTPTPFSPDELAQFKALLQASSQAPLTQCQGTGGTTFGSESGTFSTPGDGGQDVVLKDVARSGIGQPDVISVRDVPPTQQALEMLRQHIPAEFDTTHNGLPEPHTPIGLVPSDLHAG